MIQILISIWSYNFMIFKQLELYKGFQTVYLGFYNHVINVKGSEFGLTPVFFFTGISFCFNEKLPYHLLTK